MKPGAIYLSFLVRLWSGEQQAGGEGESPAWQGEVLHIQSGSKVLFQDMDRLFQYLQDQLEGEDQFEC
jgi:hypothetical protein